MVVRWCRCTSECNAWSVEVCWSQGGIEVKKDGTWWNLAQSWASIWEVKLAPAPLTFGSVSGAPELLGTQMNHGQADRWTVWMVGLCSPLLEGLLEQWSRSFGRLGWWILNLLHGCILGMQVQVLVPSPTDRKKEMWARFYKVPDFRHSFSTGKSGETLWTKKSPSESHPEI